MSIGTIFPSTVTKAFKRISLTLCFITALLFPFQSFSQSSDCDEVPVTLIVEYFGRTELPSILCGSEVYFSVPGLFDFLKVKNEYSPDFKEISGFLKHQDDTFIIDEPAKEITYNSKIFPLESSDIIRTRTNLFLKASHFTSIFGLQNEFSSRNLAATLVPEFELPAVKVAKRKQMRENLRRIQGEFLADTTIRRDRPLVHFGAAAWNVNATQRTDGIYYNRFALGLGGLLAGGEFIGNINHSTGMEFTSRNLFYQWRHVNNDRELFRQFTVGKISSRSISSIYHPIVGAQITNAQTFVKRSFGTYTLSDYTKPDWIVELYINNNLVDYTQADASGFFSFDVPLTYGSTEISLRYYGPWGEEEVSHKNITIPFNFLSPGEFQYALSSGIVEDGKNSKFFQGRADYGLTSRVTIGGGLEYLSSLEENPIIPFLNTSVRLPANILVSGEYMHEVGYKGNLSYTSPSSLRLDLSYKKFEEEQSAVRFSYLEERKASLTMPIHVGKFIGTSRLNFQQNILQNNSYTHLEWMLSGSAWGVRANLTNSAFVNQYSDPLVYSKLSTGIRLPGNFVFSPKVEFEYLRDGLTSFEGEVRKRFFKKVNFQASYIRNLRFDQYYINVGLSFDLGFTRIGMNGSTNRRYTSFSQSAGGSVMFEPTDNSLAFDHRPMMGRGSIKFEPFLDENGNGVKDQGESGLVGVNVHIQGGGMREQTPGGVTIFKGLEPYISYFFTLDTRNLQNISWQVDHESLEVFVNPNQMKIIEVPVKVMGEVAGFVNLGQQGIGGIRMNIFNAEDKLISSILSASDGYFSYMGLPSGTYTARVDEAQLEKLDLNVTSDFPFTINNTREGDYVDNLEFFLTEVHEEGITEKEAAPELAHELENREDLPAAKKVLEATDMAAAFLEKKEEKLAVDQPTEVGLNLTESQRYVGSPEGLIYKVQFLTSQNAISEGDSRFNGFRHVTIEETPTGYRYLWGVTGLPGEATRLQKELRSSGFQDAYVVHYFNGERIPVAEALKIRSGLRKPVDQNAEKVQESQKALQETEQPGLHFKVQIAASTVPLESDHSTLKGMRNVSMYQHEGLYKYSLGNFTTFGEANQFKNVLRSQGIDDAFVVPFENDERLEKGKARGMIYFRDSTLKGIGGISLEIRDAAGKIVMNLLSEADGSFMTPNLEPGTYSARLNKEELEKIGMKAGTPEIIFEIKETSQVQNSTLEFFLQAAGDDVPVFSKGEDEGLVFKVQVLATVPKFSVDHQLLKGLEGVERYKHRGLYKYTVGQSDKLEKIRQVRSKVLKSGFEDAFIVAFLNGTRINLQEMTGQVFVQAGSEKQGLEGISVEIFNKEEKLMTSLVSDRNGKFYFLGLKPGIYTARLDSGQMSKLGLRTSEPTMQFEIQRNTEGVIKQPVLFKLEKIKDEHLQQEEGNKEIEYRIQLAASNVPLGPNHPTLKGIENISMYHHNGMYKYTVGSTYSLREARELMEEIRASHEFTLFIVGFKKGNRVLITE